VDEYREIIMLKHVTAVVLVMLVVLSTIEEGINSQTSNVGKFVMNFSLSADENK